MIQIFTVCNKDLGSRWSAADYHLILRATWMLPIASFGLVTKIALQQRPVFISGTQ